MATTTLRDRHKSQPEQDEGGRITAVDVGVECFSFFPFTGANEPQ